MMVTMEQWQITNVKVNINIKIKIKSIIFKSF
jgi:hypothetical protein